MTYQKWYSLPIKPIKLDGLLVSRTQKKIRMIYEINEFFFAKYIYTLDAYKEIMITRLFHGKNINSFSSKLTKSNRLYPNVK